MSSWPCSDDSGALVTLRAEVLVGQTLPSSSSSYSVLEFIGEGGFGKVAKCQNLTTEETVAVKMLRKNADMNQDTEKEVSMLEALSVLNPDHANVVRFYERFEYMGWTCLALEMLDRSLYDLIMERNWEPLSLNEIRPIAQQLLVALDALKELGVLHTDIKPDNVMLVNKQDQPFRIKLIDFGQAFPASELELGMKLQAVGYRAPEVSLGLPLTEAVDVWGVGCVLAFLYLAGNLFRVDCEYQMIKCMVKVLGQPEDRLLHAALFTQYFFSEEEAADGPTWRLMTSEEYTVVNNLATEDRDNFINLPSSVVDLVNIYPPEEAAETEDRTAFVEIMEGLLHLDGDQRMSPRQALHHPFITMTHLKEHPVSREYFTTSQTMMSICPVEDAFIAAPLTRSIALENLAVSFDDDPTTGTADGAHASCSDEDDLAACSSNELPSCSYDKDPGSFEGANDTDLAAAAPASSRRSKTLKRIHRFFSRITASLCCCWRPTTED